MLVGVVVLVGPGVVGLVGPGVVVLVRVVVLVGPGVVLVGVEELDSQAESSFLPIKEL